MASIHRLLAEARARIAPRAGPEDVDAAPGSDALVVDTRPGELRRRDGDLPGAVVIERNVLERRLDPITPH
jgi:hypothetical protein